MAILYVGIYRLWSLPGPTHTNASKPGFEAALEKQGEGPRHWFTQELDVRMYVLRNTNVHANAKQVEFVSVDINIPDICVLGMLSSGRA